MRNLLKTLLVFAFVTVIAAPTAHARTLDEIKKSGVLRLAADGATPPFNYFKGKDLVGFEIDLGNEIARRLGVAPEWKVQPFNTLLIAIGQDKFDLIATSHAITPERDKVVDFINPHYCTGAIIVTKKGGPKTAKDLAGKIVTVPVGTVYYEKLKTIPGIKEIRTVPNETDGLQSLLGDRTDAWVTEKFVALEAVKKHADAALETGDIILPQANAMVISEGNKDLQVAVNGTLKNILADGTYDRLAKKYFDTNLKCK